MADTFRALLVTKEGDRQSVAVTELTDADLMEGDVTVAVEHSTVNYKDGLAITGKAPIIRKFPLIPGIDLAGRVLHSEDPRFQAGDRVVLNGYGLGEVHHGGYAERARVKGDWLIRLPENISTANAMAIGTGLACGGRQQPVECVFDIARSFPASASCRGQCHHQLRTGWPASGQHAPCTFYADCCSQRASIFDLCSSCLPSTRGFCAPDTHFQMAEVGYWPQAE